MIRTSTTFLFAFLSLVACSSEVTPPPSGIGGSGGSGSSSSSGTGGATGECPLAPPTSGTPCNVPMGQSCDYGQCCPRIFTCNASVWEESDVNCGAQADCPATPPAQGEPCNDDPCAQASPCGYACDQGSAVFAECTNGAWATTSSPCSGVVSCNGVDCAPGEICVETAGGAGFFYKCEANPCAPGALSCQCAGGTICGPAPMECAVTSSTQLSCTCPVCP